MPFVAIIYRLSAKIFQLSHKDSISQAIYMARAVLGVTQTPFAGERERGLQRRQYKQFIYPQRCGRAHWRRERERATLLLLLSK